jgi:hypothetical protein
MPSYATHTSLCHPYQSGPIFLSPPYHTPYQILAAQVESPCAVNVIPLSDSIAGRRNIFSNSRIKGALGGGHVWRVAYIGS